MGSIAERPYAGNALVSVHPTGKVRLPDFVRRVLERHPSTIFIGLHPTASCLIAFDSRHRQSLADEISQCPDPDHRQSRMRRLFGTTEEFGWPCDHLRLPGLARGKAMIGTRSLFVGTGGGVEIWDPATAATSGDEILADLAAMHLAAAGAT